MSEEESNKTPEENESPSFSYFVDSHHCFFFLFFFLVCNDKQAFFTSTAHRGYKLWSCQNVCDALSYLFDNIFIRFGTKLYKQSVGIPMGTNCAPLIADLLAHLSRRLTGELIGYPQSWNEVSLPKIV